MTRLALTLAFGLCLPSLAMAQGKTTLQVLVASVSTNGKDVDGALKGMAQDFKRNGLAFSSFKLVRQESLSLAPGETGNVTLPNGTAKVTLLKIEGSSARVKVASPGSTSELGMKAGSEAYIDAGAHGQGKVFLAVKR
ncbi:MAG: hypothetical protein HY901_14500 [Deltaproteobacteria bacterium]|nr:hypothetical protein [Deltaproteobacteria bacterium]